MTNRSERMNAFKAEIAAVCERHRIGMVGTCSGEQIYGEITLVDFDNPRESGWLEVEKHYLNWSE
jgi:hypothetical protein